MRRVEIIVRLEDVEFFLRFHGLWEGLVSFPPPPDPPFDIETLEPIDPLWQAIRAWISADDDEPHGKRPDSGTKAPALPGRCGK